MIHSNAHYKSLINEKAQGLGHIIMDTDCNFLSVRDRICYKCPVCNRERDTSITNYLRLKISCNKCNAAIIFNGEVNWRLAVYKLAQERNQTIMEEKCNFSQVKDGKVSFICNICGKSAFVGLNNYMRLKNGCRYSHVKEPNKRPPLYMWKKAVHINYNNRCAFTGEKGTPKDRLVCHHIQGVKNSPELAEVPANGILILGSIHRKFHCEWGYKNNNHQQLEEFYLMYKYDKKHDKISFTQVASQEQEQEQAFCLDRKQCLRPWESQGRSEFPWTSGLLKYKTLLDLSILEASDAQVRVVKLADLKKLATDRNHTIIDLFCKDAKKLTKVFESFNSTKATFFCKKHQKESTVLTAIYKDSPWGLLCCSQEARQQASVIQNKNDKLLEGLVLEINNNGHIFKGVGIVGGTYINVSTQVIIGFGCPLHPEASYQTSVKNYRQRIKNAKSNFSLKKSAINYPASHSEATLAAQVTGFVGELLHTCICPKKLRLLP